MSGRRDEGRRRKSVFVWVTRWERERNKMLMMREKRYEMSGLVSAVLLVSKQWTRAHTLTHTLAHSQIENTIQIQCKLYECSQNSLCCLSVHTLLTSINTSPSASSSLAYTAASRNSVQHWFSWRCGCSDTFFFFWDFKKVHIYCQYSHTDPTFKCSVHLVAHWLRENPYMKNIASLHAM